MRKTILLIIILFQTSLQSQTFNGNLVLGTATPNEKLTVKGKIHAQEVKVDMKGSLVPNYIFANDYKLIVTGNRRIH